MCDVSDTFVGITVSVGRPDEDVDLVVSIQVTCDRDATADVRPFPSGNGVLWTLERARNDVEAIAIRINAVTGRLQGPRVHVRVVVVAVAVRLGDAVEVAVRRRS